jgi:hypothetical protein
MKTTKKLGIWMDHAVSHVISIENDIMESQVIESNFSHEEKEESLSKSESLMHNKENHKQSAYYKQLQDIIRNYDDVLLFGPTSAKVELYNILKKDHRFANIKIEKKQTDKMHVNKMQEFVKDYFNSEV